MNSVIWAVGVDDWPASAPVALRHDEISRII